MQIPGINLTRLVLFFAVALIWIAEASPALAQRNAKEPKPIPMRRPPPATNSVCWHTILVTPKPGVPKIHFYDKLNPLWWLQNGDDPEPPNWYRPDDKHRNLKWRFRNPFHNFDHYIIGVADKKFYRSGRYPERNSDPNGGWNFAIGRRLLVPLPFVSYERRWCTFYFGWREHGAFGMKLQIHHQKKAEAETTARTTGDPKHSNPKPSSNPPASANSSQH